MRKFVILALLCSLIGLGAVQYRFLVIGLKLGKAQFDLQAGQALREMSQQLYSENQLTALLAAVVRQAPGSFLASIDTLEEAAQSYFADFLQDQLLAQGIHADIDFALIDGSTEKLHLQSAGFQPQTDFANYRIPLGGYLPGQCGCPLYLRLQVNNLLQYLLASLRWLLIPCLAFFAIIALCLWWLLRFLRQQRQLDEVKNDFINNLAHELKTPVFTIGMAAQMLESQLPDGKAREYLKVIQAENGLLGTHADKVLELASLKSGTALLNRQPQDVHLLLSQIAASFQGGVARREGAFQFLPQASQSMSSIDATHLGNAVQNLLDNALKYSLDRTDITLSTYNQGKRLYIAVSDQGIGISPAFQKKIFSRFFRVPHGDQHEVKGFGLGLSYARQVALLHGGDIKVESQPGKGSIFVIELPNH
jgi:two-component system, OmpR family, phosphate regulon sensor histidine kinase PhoR